MPTLEELKALHVGDTIVVGGNYWSTLTGQRCTVTRRVQGDNEYILARAPDGRNVDLFHEDCADLQSLPTAWMDQWLRGRRR